MIARPQLDKLSRKRFLRELAEFADQYRDLIDAAVDGFAVDVDARSARRGQSRAYRFFCETYFPHYVTAGTEPSEFQQWVYDTFPAWAATPGFYQSVAAPRGEGKSTLLTQIGCIYLVVHGLAHMVPLIMGSTESAEEMLEIVKAELEVNPRLRMDFPDATGRGRTWRTGLAITANNIKLKAFGSLKRLRGARHGPWRPDYVFIDDLENDENVRSKEQRDKLEKWIKSAVLNLGPPDGSMRVMFGGTLLHYDAVLKRLMQLPLWKGRARVFSSIVRWPDRMDLWDRWQETLSVDGEDAARAFYQAHQADMDAGARVSWPAMRNLYSLMLKRADDPKAFDTEQQNDPTAGEDCPFSGILQFWVQPSRDWVLFGAHDPSLGKTARRGDPSATLVGAYDRVHGILDVVAALIRRRVPDKQIEDIIALQMEWNCLLWGIEAVAFQEFLRTELVKRSAERHVQVPARPISANSDKTLRIESLQPHVANGLIRFNRNQRTLIEQVEHWPEAAHDDGPDCLEMLWQLARRGIRGGAASVRMGGRRRSESLLAGYAP